MWFLKLRLAAVLLAVAACFVGVTAASAEDNSDAASSGKYVADLGFRPQVNGFSFENYGRPPDTDLTNPPMHPVAAPTQRVARGPPGAGVRPVVMPASSLTVGPPGRKPSPTDLLRFGARARLARGRSLLEHREELPRS